MNKKYILHKECREAQWSKMSEKIGGPDQGEEVVLLTRSVLIFARGDLLNKCHLTFNVMLDHFKRLHCKCSDIFSCPGHFNR